MSKAVKKMCKKLAYKYATSIDQYYLDDALYEKVLSYLQAFVDLGLISLDDKEMIFDELEL